MSGALRCSGRAGQATGFSRSDGSPRSADMRCCSWRRAASNASRRTTYTSSCPSRSGRSMSTTTSPRERELNLDVEYLALVVVSMR